MVLVPKAGFHREMHFQLVVNTVTSFELGKESKQTGLHTPFSRRSKPTHRWSHTVLAVLLKAVPAELRPICLLCQKQQD